MQPLFVPEAQVTERLHRHRICQFQNQVMGFGKRNEVVRKDHAQFGMLDTAKRFDTVARNAGAQGHFGLIVIDHVPRGDRLRQRFPIKAGLDFLGLEEIGQLARAEIRARQDYRFDRFRLEKAAHGRDRLGIELGYRNDLALRAARQDFNDVDFFVTGACEFKYRCGRIRSTFAQQVRFLFSRGKLVTY